MQLTLESHGDIVIQSWEPGLLKVNGEAITHHAMIHSTEVSQWLPANPASLTLDDFAPLLSLQPEIILFGSGSTQVFPAIELITEIMQRGIAFEVMDSAAACRTYNILSAEQRPVVAAILIE